MNWWWRYSKRVETEREREREGRRDRMRFGRAAEGVDGQGGLPGRRGYT